MSDTRSFPILIPGKGRFAIVGPGFPNPTVIVASGSDFSDLAGYYSVREAGLEEVFDIPSSTQMNSIFRLFLSEDTISSSYQAVDVWVPSHDDSMRAEMFSLLIEAHGLPRAEKFTLRRFEDALSKQIARLVDAFREGDLEQVQYIGQMLSTFVALLEARTRSSELRRAKKMQLYRWAILVYGIIILFGGILAALSSTAAFKTLVNGRH